MYKLGCNILEPEKQEFFVKKKNTLILQGVHRENPAAPLSHFANPQARRSEVLRYALFNSTNLISHTWQINHPKKNLATPLTGTALTYNSLGSSLTNPVQTT